MTDFTQKFELLSKNVVIIKKEDEILKKATIYKKCRSIFKNVY